MAKYRINGSNYEVDNALQGDELNTTLTQLAETTAAQNQKKFLDFIGAAEGASYDTIVGGRQKITDFASHPNIVGMRTAEGPSTAAGKYQITGTTARDIAGAAGTFDFSPESQDKMALALIARRGASDDVTSGNFNGAIAKLGKEWASLPSSTYSQGKRSQAWVDQALGQFPAVTPQAAQLGMSYGPIIKNNDQATLGTNKDWLRASSQIYNWKERKSFSGTDEDLADYGKSVMGYFNNNVVAMTNDAAQLAGRGTKDDKEAFLYLMDQYDANNVSWAGTGRAALGMVTDPTNLIGVGTLGMATAGKIAVSAAAKQGVQKTLLTSLGRTGVQAGILGGIQGTTVDAIKQAVEITGGRKDSVDSGELAGHAVLGVGAGVVLGTAADALLSVAAPAAKVAMGKIAEVLGIGKKVKVGVPEVSLKEPPAVIPKEAPTASPKTTPVGEVGVVPTEAPRSPTTSPNAAATLPISSTLTQEELQALGQRGQKGRLWEDDISNGLPLTEHPADALVIPASADGLRATQRNMASLSADAEKVAVQLRGLDDTSLKQTLEVLRSSTSLQDTPTVFRAVQILHDEVRVAEATTLKQINAEPNSPHMQEWLAKLDGLQNRKVDIALADDAMGSFGGSLNRQRQEGLVGLQGSSVESLMAEKGLTRPAAELEYAKLVDASQVSAKAKQVAADYEAKIQAALDAGDMAEVAKQSLQKRWELNAVAEEAAPGGSSFMAKIHHGAAGLREGLISNLFTLKTVLINLVPAAVKTLSIPTLKYLVTNPLEKAAMAELGAHYAAMRGTIRAALKASQAAFKYEQSILTRDSGRLMEGEMTLTGKLGGAIRFFPRVLNASDEFLSQINYAGFVAGKAANKAVIEGTEAGLTGKALKDFTAEAVTKAKSVMYEAADEAKIQPIINKGVNLGYSGADLMKYVQAEAVKAPDSLRHGTDKQALDFSRDTLYKRGFSGGNAGDGWLKKEVSGGAVAVESFLNKAPEISLIIGQLFFRTPIRVFEEGIRLTPGVQILAPGFMKDLSGANGQLRQVRAQGEALVSLAITGAALTLYANGNITGSGVYNSYKQDKTRKDGPGPEPYSIRFKDGSTWVFKNMDPVSTPLKILINAFEGMDELKIKEAQEQYVNRPAYKLILARISVATMAIAAAVTDANLVSGLKGTIDFAKELADPEGDEAAIIKKFGSDLAMLVPNTLHKIAQTVDPRMRDPATLFQAIEAKLGHGLAPVDGIKSSFAYDPLGQVRSMADVGSMWNIFSTASVEDRARGHSEAHQKVMLEFERLAQETGAIFSPPPVKNPLTGDLDLRTMMTKDGKQTLYDQWQENYRNLNPDRILLPLSQASAPDGTFKQKGMKVEILQSQMKMLQDAAFSQLLTDERVRDRLILSATQKARAQGGLLDFSNRNK